MIGDNIRRKKVKLNLSNKAHIYKPPVCREKGEIDGEKFTIVIKDGENPEGTPPKAAENLNLIAWDEVVYLTWDLPTGAYDSQMITIKRGETIADEIEIDSKSLNELEIPENIVNDIEHEFYVTAIASSIEVDSDSVFGTPEDKTPENLEVGDVIIGGVDLSWDNVNNIKGFEVVFLLGSEVVREFSTTNNSVSVESLDNGVYEAKVRSVSVSELFTSDYSNVVEFFTSTAPENFDVQVSGTDVTFSWDEVENVEGYNIYYKEASGSFYSLLNSSPIESTSYEDTVFANGDVDFYVIPTSSGYESVKSEIVTRQIEAIAAILQEAITDYNALVYDATPIEESISEGETTESTIIHDATPIEEEINEGEVTITTSIS